MNHEEFKKKFDDVMENTFIFGLEGVLAVVYDGGYILATDYTIRDNNVFLYVKMTLYPKLHSLISPTGVISLDRIVDIVTYMGTPEEKIKVVRFDER